MTRATTGRFAAVGFLVAGIAVGYVAAKGDLTAVGSAPAQNAADPDRSADQRQQAQSTQLAQANVPADKKAPVTTTAKPLIDIMRENPDAIPLDPNDPSRDLLKLFRDPKDNPKREPGPINIQKTVGGLAYQGIPTFFRAPVALGPEDLKAGKVEVAIMGASVDMPCYHDNRWPSRFRPEGVLSFFERIVASSARPVATRRGYLANAARYAARVENDRWSRRLRRWTYRAAHGLRAA